MRYAIIGGFAVNVWGSERATLDIDVLVGGRRHQFEALIVAAGQQGILFRPQFLEANPLLQGVMVRCRIENLHVDFLRPRDAHDRNVLRRRRQATFAGRQLWFPAPEDLIVMKLKAGRDRDFDDATRVVEQNKEHLNYRYLSRWAKPKILLAYHDELLIRRKGAGHRRLGLEDGIARIIHDGVSPAWAFRVILTDCAPAPPCPIVNPFPTSSPRMTLSFPSFLIATPLGAKLPMKKLYRLLAVRW